MAEEINDKKIYTMKLDKVYNPSVPSILETRGLHWYNAGNDNLYPQFIVDLFNKSAIAKTAIVSKSIAVAGQGLRTESGQESEILLNANEEESYDDIWNKIVLDYQIFTGYCLNVVWDNAGENIAAIYHVDYSKVRSGHIDKDTDRVEYYWVCSDWSNYKRPHFKPKAYHRYDPSKAKEYPSQILYYYNHTPSMLVYGLPSWSGCMTDVAIDVEISSYHLGHLKQGLTPGMLINMNSGIPTPEQRQSIFSQISDQWSGSENAGKFFLSFNESKETQTEIQTIEPTGSDYYTQLESRITTRILSGFRITSPKIVGIYELAGGGGIKNVTKDELIIDYELFKQQVVIPDTKVLLKAFNRLYKEMGGTEKLVVEPIKLFPDLDNTLAPAPGMSAPDATAANVNQVSPGTANQDVAVKDNQLVEPAK